MRSLSLSRSFLVGFGQRTSQLTVGHVPDFSVPEARIFVCRRCDAKTELKLAQTTSEKPPKDVSSPCSLLLLRRKRLYPSKAESTTVPVYVCVCVCVCVCVYVCMYVCTRVSVYICATRQRQIVLCFNGIPRSPTVHAVFYGKHVSVSVRFCQRRRNKIHNSSSRLSAVSAQHLQQRSSHVLPC